MIRAKPPTVIAIGAALHDVKEEAFCLLIADGVPIAMAFRTAGFKTRSNSSALALYRRADVQARITEIIKARASTPPIGLPEVTDMLKRVYVGAIHSNEYTPAHNAAFSLARLHGLVVDRAQLDVIRRPSREPDAPSEVALSDWIQRLPSLPHTTPSVIPKRDEPLVIEGSIHGSDLDAAAPRDGVVSETTSWQGPVTGSQPPRAYSGEVSVEKGPETDEGTTLPRAEDLF